MSGSVCRARFFLTAPRTGVRTNLWQEGMIIMMKTQTETFRGYGKLFGLGAQTAVECRFPEAETVLSACATAHLAGADAGNGEVRYFGRAHFSIVYEDADRRVCRAEKGVEFSAVARDERIVPAHTVRAQLAVENVSVRKEGASIFVTALLGADIAVFGEQSFDYLSGGELVCKRDPVAVYTAHLADGTTEIEDDFEVDRIGDILQHAETVHITAVSCSAGTLCTEGEVFLGVLALRGEDLVSFERLIPFRIDVPSESAQAGCRAQVRVTVPEVSLTADADEEKGKCRVRATLVLRASGVICEEVAVDGVTDAFSRTNRVRLSYSESGSEGAGETTQLTERVSGRAALSSGLDFSDTLQAVTLQRAEANLVRGENGMRAEGVALATLLVRAADGSRRGIEMSLPFSVPVQAENADVDVIACGMSARQKEEGTIDAEATLKFTFTERLQARARLVSSAEEGEPVPEKDCAISVYVPRAGDGLWELAKRLNKSPEEVVESNPDLEFPIREGQRVVIYRKKAL